MAKRGEIQAGGEFVKQFAGDSPLVRGLREASARLEAWAQKLVNLASRLARKIKAERLSWEEAFGEPRPETVEDWRRWAARLGLDPNWIVAGDWTPGQVMPLIEGYLQRRKDERRKNQRKVRRDSAKGQGRPLTARQAEVAQIVGECKGNLSQAARRLGRDRKTVEEVFRAGMAKLGKTVVASRDKERLFARDRRGQDDVADIDDARREAVDEDQRRKYRRRS